MAQPLEPRFGLCCPLCCRSGALRHTVGPEIPAARVEEPKPRARHRLPPSRAGRGRWAQRGLGCLSGGGRPRLRGAAARAGGERDNAAARKPFGELGDPAPQLLGSRLLAVSASFPHTPPGPPEPQAFPALLLLLFTLAVRPESSSRLPALPCSLPGESSFSGSPCTRTHTYTRLPGLPSSRPPISSSELTPPSGGGLMSLKHHAAAAEEGESYTRTEKHSS